MSMKFTKMRFIAAIFTLLSTGCLAQTFSVTYDFNNVNSSSGRIDPTPVPIVEGVTFGSFTAIAPTGNPNTLSLSPNASGRFSFTGWPGGGSNNSDNFTGAINTGQYFEVVLTPQTYYTISLDTITFTIQRSGTGIRQFSVRSSLDGFAGNLNANIIPVNASLKVVAGNIFQIADATSTAQVGCKVNFPHGTNITTPVTIRFYGWNAESGGTFSIDNVNINGSSTISPIAPVILIDPVNLSFQATAVNSTGMPLTYAVQGNNLTDPIVINTTVPFTVSLSAEGVYTNSISIPIAQASAPTNIYVRFAPTSVATFTAAIVNNSTAATVKNVTVSGDGINPNNFVFDFNSCTDAGNPGLGFTSYSVTGAQKWACTTFGNNTTNGVNMNGFLSGPQDNEDWLITPPLNLGAISLPVLRFWSRGEFVGPTLQLLVSTNYDGLSDPNTATWTLLNGDFPPLTNAWKLTDGIDLSAFKNASDVYFAFKYTSSPDLGAARWTVDDIDITNRTRLFSAIPSVINFGEASAGTNSASIPVTLKAIGYGNVTIAAPAGYSVSADNINFSNIAMVMQVMAEAGTTVYVRFNPATKQLKIEGKLRFTATGLDSGRVSLSGTSYPRVETFDVGTYNLSFFGSNPTNNPTQNKINNQVANVATVLQRLNLDIVGIQEVSNDVALDSLVKKLPNRKALVSNRWSFSFLGPDPNFPPQKIGFIYDTTTTQLVSSRVMFSSLYDSARGSFATRLPNYPGGAVNFWAGGRLPFIATFDVKIGTVTKRVVVVDIHAKSSADAASYNRRVYDVKVLFDSLAQYYSNDQLFIVGDYNDRLFGSTNGTSVSPFKNFVDDVAGYSSLTLPFDQAGEISFIGGSAMIDHLVVSNEIAGFNIESSTTIEDPRGYISGYGSNTASDHFPVYSRFNFDQSLPVTLINFAAEPANGQVKLKWATASELNNQQFVVERSAKPLGFTAIAVVKGQGTTSIPHQYLLVDNAPLTGWNYYRLKQVDIDGKFINSKIVSVNMGSILSKMMKVYPNPVASFIQIKGGSTSNLFFGSVSDVQGKVTINVKGSLTDISRQISAKLGAIVAGVYTIELVNGKQKQVLRFIKQ